jgi:anti-anti-sigma regulatory factor
MLQIHEEVEGHTTIFTFKGQFSLESILGVKAVILKAKEMGSQHVLLNFSNLTGMDAEGLRQLFHWYYKVQPPQFRLSCVCPPSHLWEDLEPNHTRPLPPEEANNAVSF